MEHRDTRSINIALLAEGVEHRDTRFINIALLAEGVEHRDTRSINIALLAEGVEHRDTRSIDMASWRRAGASRYTFYKHRPPGGGRELTQALADFNISKEKPREAVAVRSAETDMLPTLIREATGILRNEIDRLVNLFSRTDSQFVASYRSARVIVDRAAHHGSQTPPPVPTP